MTQKKVTSKKPTHQNRDEHELLQQDMRRPVAPQVPSKRNSERDDFRWIADVRDVLSPYWSSRAESHSQTNR